MKLPGIALIGSRSCSLAVQRACHYLAAEFARRCFCIISGMAMGCDTSAHRGALKAGGRTVALVGHGRDTVYPPQNRRLAQVNVLNGGLLLSEYDLGAPVTRYTLEALDRVQASLALTAVVFQTGVTRGTMHAAMSSVNSSKPLFVVKYSDESTDRAEVIAGNHMLVREAGAWYIRGTDNLDELALSILSSYRAQSRQRSIPYGQCAWLLMSGAASLSQISADALLRAELSLASLLHQTTAHKGKAAPRGCLSC